MWFAYFESLAFLFCGVSVSFIMLTVIPEENFISRSICITLIAVLSIVYYLHKRYSKRFAIQADLLIAVSTLAQFPLPVFYLAFYCELNPDLDIYGHRYGYAITSFAVLVGQFMFFLGYESVQKSLYFPRVKITGSSFGSLFLVLLPLLVLIWIARYVLLSTGSYYHIHRSDYQFISPFYSVLVQLSGYGLIIVGALFLITFSEERKIDR